ncbi:double-stranded RNA-binding protein Staufen homolog isoform X1 [Daphnia pulex]|uniref:double-stranded RNA-binding protein Staufen homolog isoform X1 n=2 Tax=Daphnia pulex TaxID=6669 RepID=UPI001EE04705|nr:double-stranded RNA-binding protein Staufen homolog isoform X1 [Daphnia pulex]
MNNVQERSAYESRNRDVKDQVFEPNWKMSGGAQEALIPAQGLELKNTIEELHKIETFENVGCIEKENRCESTDDTDFSMGLQDKSEQNGKKKTPMCLVNELARHHKIQPQYRLTEESGPAHQKTFVVNLKLGEEQYSATGQSIKKAQHAAAELALKKTDYQVPEPKPKVKCMSNSQCDKPITPTVELNALAMKLNFQPVYTNLAPLSIKSKIQEDGEQSPVCKGDFRLNQVDHNERFLNADFQRQHTHTSQRFPSSSNQRYYFNRYQQAPVTHRVTLAVGHVFVTGEGLQPQAARHHAAQQALEQLRGQTLIDKVQLDEAAVISEANTDSDLKSPVSLVHELALKLNLTVEFTVLNESGPPHMRNFIVQCKLGEVTTQGEGNCKKVAKRKAAEIMIDELKKVHPNGVLRPLEGNTVSPPRIRVKNKSTIARKKPRNLVKDVTSASNGCLGTKPQDPISQLVQLQQARKEKEPVFTVLSERGIPRQSPEFVVEVAVGSVTATGVGTKKKDAKRAAALKALDALGDSSKSSASSDTSVAVETLLQDAPLSNSNCTGRQMVPGLLLLGGGQSRKIDSPFITDSSNATGIKETTQSSRPPKTSGGLRPEIRLRYLAQVLEYEVEFSDFPKGKKGDFVSLVTLNTNPPQVSHGLGATLEEAHDNAASNMMKLLSEGSQDDTVGPNKENADQRSTGPQ